VFDLGCPANALQLHHIDRRTKAVLGCGRRLIYVESCESRGLRRECTWMLDTPSYVQQTWPQLQPSLTLTQAAAAGPAGVAPPPSPSNGDRPIRTGLDGPTQSIIPTRNERRRPVQTELFDDEDTARILEHRR
jgi:hypothetical protein